jgi:hypothetical protein
MAENPGGMSDQEWSTFQSRYHSDPNQMAQQRAAAGGAAPAPSATTGGGLQAAQPGVPGAVDPALKNPAPAPSPTLQPSPAPSIGMGNTVDAPQQGGRVQAPGLLAAGQEPSAQPQNPASAMQAQLRTSIMGMLAPQAAPSVTDADISPQSQAFAAAAQRSQGARRAELAHQASRGGWADSGGFDQRLDALSQQTGQAIGQNDANLIGQKMEQRRLQLNTALQAAQQMGMADEANNLQRQLANLGAQVDTRGQDIQREGTQLQGSLANLDASTRIYLGDLAAQMQQQGYSTQERIAAMDAALKQRGIDMQGRLGELDTALRSQLGNRQIDLGYDQLGVNVGEIQARMNREAVIGAMG